MDTTRDFHTKVSLKEKDKYCMISLICGIGLPRWLSGKELPTSIGDIREAYSIKGRSPEKGMASHSNILAWRILWTEEPGRLCTWLKQFSICGIKDMTEMNLFSSVQSLSHVQLFATPRTAACQASLFITNSGSLLKLHPVGDAIRPSHLLSSPSPPAFNLSQHQGLFQWVTSSHLVAKVLEFQLQHQSFQWIFRTDFL